MKLHLNNAENINLVHSCNLNENGFQIRIGEGNYRQSLILTPEKLEMWSVSEVSNATEAEFELLVKFQAEVVILGTGANHVFPSQEISKPLIKAGIGLEVMNTPAACRTYNALVSDGRKVLAALIL